MNAIKVNLDMFSGETPTFTFLVTVEGTANGTPVDITGATINYALRTRNASGTLLFTKTVGSGITIANQLTEKGIYRVAYLASDTAALAGPYYYEARVTLSGVILTVVYGALEISHSGI